MSISLSDVMHQITQGTVFGDWFSPMEEALTKVRYSDKPFTTMSMSAFILFGGLRQVLAITTLREQAQHVFHLDTRADKMPLARSTYSDALASRFRRDILRPATDQLVNHAGTITRPIVWIGRDTGSPGDGDRYHLPNRVSTL